MYKLVGSGDFFCKFSGRSSCKRCKIGHCFHLHITIKWRDNCNNYGPNSKMHDAESCVCEMHRSSAAYLPFVKCTGKKSNQNISEKMINRTDRVVMNQSGDAGESLTARDKCIV